MKNAKIINFYTITQENLGAKKMRYHYALIKYSEHQILVEM